MSSGVAKCFGFQVVFLFVLLLSLVTLISASSYAHNTGTPLPAPPIEEVLSNEVLCRIAEKATLSGTKNFAKLRVLNKHFLEIANHLENGNSDVKEALLRENEIYFLLHPKAVGKKELVKILNNQVELTKSLLAKLNRAALSSLQKVLQERPWSSIDNTKVYLAAFVANYGLNLSAASSLARSENTSESWLSDWDTAEKAAWKAMSLLFGRAVSEIVYSAGYMDVCNLAQYEIDPKLNSALKELGSPTPLGVDKTTYYLGQLLSLDWFIMNQHQNFRNFFYAAEQVVKDSRTLEEVNRIIDQNMKANDQLANNPFIQSQFSFLAGVRKLLLDLETENKSHQ